MSNASTGQPLGYRHAVVLQSAQTVQGTAVTPAGACGVVQARLQKRSNNAHYFGPGTPNFVSRKGGMTITDWDLRYEAVQSGIKGLLQKAVRTNGVLPFFTLGVGYKDDVTPTANKDADQIQDCKVGRLRLGLDVSNGHAPLTADLSGVGGLVTDLTTLVPASDTTTPFWSFEAIWTKGGSAFPGRSFELNVDHNLKPDAVIPGAAPSSFLRGWSFLTEHSEVITGSVSRYARAGVSVQADTIPSFTLGLVLTNTEDSVVLNLGLTGVDFGEEEGSEDQNGIFYTYPFQAASWSLT